MRRFCHVEMLWVFLCAASFPWEVSGVQTTHVRVEESAERCVEEEATEGGSSARAARSPVMVQLI